METNEQQQQKSGGLKWGLGILAVLIVVLVVLVVVKSGGEEERESLNSTESSSTQMVDVNSNPIGDAMDTTTTMENDSNSSNNATTDSESMMGEVKTYEVEGGSFYFTPKEIKVNKGDTVKIVFKNVQGFHDWVLDEFNAKTKQIPAGETDEVTFVADKAGTFEFYCSVGTHRQQGMVGKLIVE